MNVLYISSTHAGMHQKSIYYDLAQEFLQQGHDVTIIYAREKRLQLKTDYYVYNNIKYLGVRTGNMSKNKSLLDKGISLLTVDKLFINAYKKYLGNEKFDLVLYSTPPITFINTLKCIKNKSPQAFIYLMLKDIFPQNAVDMRMFKENGLIHNFFKNKEKKLYKVVDFIGAMSPANLDYFITHNPELKEKVEVLPNAIKLEKRSLKYTRKELGLNDKSIVFVYGGNLGYPQAIEYMLDCAKSVEDLKNVQFIVAGTGSKKALIESYIKKMNRQILNI